MPGLQWCVQDYHYSAQQMFWVDGAAGSIHRASLVTEERRVVVGTAATNKDGLAVDWVLSHFH